jgi:hypothetical protein
MLDLKSTEENRSYKSLRGWPESHERLGRSDRGKLG